MSLQVYDRHLVRACEVLRLRELVTVKIDPELRNPLAYCQPSEEPGMSHFIAVSDTAPKLAANFYVWHELAHAMQEERDHIFTMGFYKQAMIEQGFDPQLFMNMNEQRPEMNEEQQERYNAIPYEKEANDVARQYCDLYEVLIEA